MNYNDTWTKRDYPVLDAIVHIADGSTANRASEREIATKIGFEFDEVQRAIRALAGEEPKFFTLKQDKDGFVVVDISGHARRVVGAWPKELGPPQDPDEGSSEPKKTSPWIRHGHSG